MTKQDLIRGMRQAVDGADLINVTGIKNYMGIDRHKVIDMLRGIDYFPNGKRKMYHIPEVAQVIIDNRVIS